MSRGGERRTAAGWSGAGGGRAPERRAAGSELGELGGSAAPLGALHCTPPLVIAALHAANGVRGVCVSGRGQLGQCAAGRSRSTAWRTTNREPVPWIDYRGIARGVRVAITHASDAAVRSACRRREIGGCSASASVGQLAKGGNLQVPIRRTRVKRPSKCVSCVCVGCRGARSAEQSLANRLMQRHKLEQKHDEAQSQSAHANTYTKRKSKRALSGREATWGLRRSRTRR